MTGTYLCTDLAVEHSDIWDLLLAKAKSISTYSRCFDAFRFPLYLSLTDLPQKPAIDAGDETAPVPG